MNSHQIAAQLYTLRDHLKTPADIARTLKRVRHIGYEAVQVSALGPIPDKDLARILREEGLVCCATHEGNILTEPEKVVEKLNTLACRTTTYPYPSGVTLNTLDDVKTLAARLNQAGKVFHDAGMTLAYHNHHIEFRRFEGRLMLEVLYAETDPRYLQGEIDTYWVQFGGGDPVDWCRRLKKRLPLLHLKDYAVDAEGKVVYAEVGRGNLDWDRIIPAAEKSGCRWFIVEQDVCPVDPFESLKLSWEYLKSACGN
jgi:sugar phosphate isomerase/epimerase